MFNVSRLSNEDPNYVDLCNILDGNELFKLPDHYNGIENKKKVTTELKLCAMKSGFALIQRSSKSTKQLQKLNLTCYLTLQCQHGIKFHGQNRNFDQVCKTKYCYHSDNLCNFCLNVFTYSCHTKAVNTRKNFV